MGCFFMMEGLKILIRNLAFILLLATFLEMLLPNKSMKGFVQLIMGLFVIAAILSPLTDFLKLDFTNEVPAWVVASSPELPVLAAENDMEGKGKSAVREQYKRILVNQVKIYVSAVEGVEDTEVDVELEEDAGGFADYPQILEVNIIYNQSKIGVKPIEPIIIGEKTEDQHEIKDLKADEIKRLVASFMQIPEEIVFVRERM